MALPRTESPVPPADARGRGRILRAARTLFMGQGYASVSMQQIADAAGVNKATLYHHFRDKEDLFVSVMEAEFTRMAADLQAVAAGGVGLREQLQRIAVHLFALRQSDFGRLSADMHEHVSERGRDYLRERCGVPWGAIRAAIAAARDRGEVRDIDPELAARVFFAMVGSQAWWTKSGGDQREPDAALAATLTELLLDGIGSHRKGPMSITDDKVEGTVPTESDSKR
jgi:AcrR family transcriptional regulator